MSVLGLSVEWTIGNNEGGPDTLQQLAVAFERAGAEVVQLGKHVFPLLPAVFEAAVDRQFDGLGVGPLTGAWAPLSPAYAKWKEAHFPGMPLMVRTGALKDGLTKSSSPFGTREWSADSFVFGTRGVVYASGHQRGSGDLPVRAPFDFDDTFKRDLQRAARKGINDAIRAADLDSMVGTIPEEAS